jgi:hypothetical protein
MSARAVSQKVLGVGWLGLHTRGEVVMESKRLMAKRAVDENAMKSSRGVPLKETVA